VVLNTHSPIRLHGIVLNSLHKENFTLLFIEDDPRTRGLELIVLLGHNFSIMGQFAAQYGPEWKQDTIVLTDSGSQRF
jgi:hypothetical protein